MGPINPVEAIQLSAEALAGNRIVARAIEHIAAGIDREARGLLGTMDLPLSDDAAMERAARLDVAAELKIATDALGLAAVALKKAGAGQAASAVWQAYQRAERFVQERT